MTGLNITAVGLMALSLASGTWGDVGVAYHVTGPGGNEGQYAVVMSGVLGDIDITCDFELDGGYTWPGDLLLSLIDPAGNGVEFGGYDMSLGYPSAGDFPGSWDTGEAGSYAHSFSLAGYGLQGGGEWTVIFANGYSGGLETDIFSGVLTALDMYPGTEPFGGCCTGVGECFIGTGEECDAAGGTYLGENTNCDNWPCGGAPEGACCFGISCTDTDIVICAAQGGEFQGEGTTCNSGICDIYGACCLGTQCTTMSLEHCEVAGGTFVGEDLHCPDVVCPWDDPTHPMFARMAGHGLISGVPEAWTVDLFVEVGQSGRLDAVAGTPELPLSLSAAGTFFQSAWGGPTAIGVDPDWYDMVPDLEWDSRVMIGAIDAAGAPFGGNDMQDVGIDWNAFESGGAVETQDGAWFVLPDAPQGQAQLVTTDDCSVVHAVHIARLTLLSADALVSFEGVVQGRLSNGSFFHEPAHLEVSKGVFEDCNDNSISDTCDIANGASSDDNGDGIPDECGECPGDVDGDGNSDIADVLAIIAYWGTDGGPDGLADIDGNGTVAIEDLLFVLQHYGGC